MNDFQKQDCVAMTLIATAKALREYSLNQTVRDEASLYEKLLTKELEKRQSDIQALNSHFHKIHQ